MDAGTSAGGVGEPLYPVAQLIELPVPISTRKGLMIQRPQSMQAVVGVGIGRAINFPREPIPRVVVGVIGLAVDRATVLPLLLKRPAESIEGRVVRCYRFALTLKLSLFWPFYDLFLLAFNV